MTAAAAAPPAAAPAPTRARQARALVALELRKVLLGRRALPVYALALLPVLPPLLRALFGRAGAELGDSTSIYSVLFQTLVLRFVLFLGCFVLFTNILRGDVRDRILHLYYLSPIRRELIVIGKYAAGVIGGSLLFGLSTAASFVLIYLPHGLSAALSRGGHLAAYVAVTALGVAGYGAVFLLLAMFTRNGMVPAAMIWGWEFVNPILPAALKKISVIHYLTSLVPVQPPEGPLALIAAPTPWWLSVPGLLALTGIVLWTGARKARTIEVSYGAD